MTRDSVSCQHALGEDQNSRCRIVNVSEKRRQCCRRYFVLDLKMFYQQMRVSVFNNAEDCVPSC